jgi:tetratricopeptide (TPR) repeat protein
LLLRVGTLTGYLGSVQQIGGAQEVAKDLITESIHAFEKLGDTEKVAEAQTGLAVCYWREGASDDARIWLGEARARASAPMNRVRVLINSALVEKIVGTLDQAMSFLDEAAPLLEIVDDQATIGRHRMQRALVLKRMGGPENLDRALIENTAAAFHFELAGHKRFLASIENNIGSLLLQFGRFEEALEHLNKSRAVLVSLKDTRTIAQVNETRARVFLAQARFTESDRAALSAVKALEQGGESALLSEALTTQAIARARLGRYQSASDLLLRAAGIIETAGDVEIAGTIYLTAIEELHTFLTAVEIAGLYSEADARLRSTSEHSERLRSCARIAVNLFRDHMQSTNALRAGGSFREDVKSYEAELIRGALDQSGGSVTRAALVLGVSHQALSDLIKHKHKALQSARTPRRPRRRSIIKKK